MPSAKRFLYIHIPRTAGTFIEKNFLDLHNKWPTGDEKHLWGVLRKNGRQFTGQHLTLKEIIEEKFLTDTQLADKQIFSVIRNPYDRVRSLSL